MTGRRFFRALAAAALILGLAWGCSAPNDQMSPSPANGGANGVSDSGLSDQTLPSDGMSMAGAGPFHLNALCGATSPCVPDDFMACSTYLPSATTGAAGASGSGASSNISTADAGAGGVSGVGNHGAEAGIGGDSNVVLPTIYGCQVQRADPKGAVLSECSLVGVGGNNAPCLTSHDCQAGFGCVGDQTSGLCQRYCCQDADACEADTYCAERPMRDDVVNGQAKGSGDTSTAPVIPVCVAAVNCDLAEPYPCKGSQCACTGGTACLVVRSDGTTTCAVPGAGKAGDTCPCAWGYVCSAATNQCLQLCYTRGDATCANNGKCQSASELPDGWGVCVGG